MKDEYYNPSIYLFASVDIVGSTALKYSQKGEKNWISQFNYFYNTFPNDFNSFFELHSQKYRITFKKMDIWKYAGDEILFLLKVTDVNTIYCAIQAFA